MTASSWEACLRDLAASLAAQSQALDDGAVPVPFQPPAGLGPLPRHLVPRALELLTESREVEQRLAAAMTGVRRHSDVARRLRPAAGPTPARFVDRTG